MKTGPEISVPKFCCMGIHTHTHTNGKNYDCTILVIETFKWRTKRQMIRFSYRRQIFMSERIPILLRLRLLLLPSFLLLSVLYFWFFPARPIHTAVTRKNRRFDFLRLYPQKKKMVPDLNQGKWKKIKK